MLELSPSQRCELQNRIDESSAKLTLRSKHKRSLDDSHKLALNYDEYPSGWAPQYEITAISIYSEEEWNAFEQNGANEN